MLPDSQDFPEQFELAETILQTVREQLAEIAPSPTDFEELRVFVEQAALAGLHLTWKWAEIIDWHNLVEELLAWYETVRSGDARSERDLLFRLRQLMRAERFKYAARNDQAVLTLLWGLAEERCGTVENAHGAYAWGLDRVVRDASADSGLGRLGARMSHRLAFIEAFEEAAAADEKEAAQMAIDNPPSDAAAGHAATPTQQTTTTAAKPDVAALAGATPAAAAVGAPITPLSQLQGLEEKMDAVMTSVATMREEIKEQPRRVGGVEAASPRILGRTAEETPAGSRASLAFATPFPPPSRRRSASELTTRPSPGTPLKKMKSVLKSVFGREEEAALTLQSLASGSASGAATTSGEDAPAGAASE